MVIIIDMQKFNYIISTYGGEFSKIIPMDNIFKGEKNKILYLHSEINDDEYDFYFITKKGIKCLVCSRENFSQSLSNFSNNEDLIFNFAKNNKVLWNKIMKEFSNNEKLFTFSKFFIFNNLGSYLYFLMFIKNLGNSNFSELSDIYKHNNIILSSKLSDDFMTILHLVNTKFNNSNSLFLNYYQMKFVCVKIKEFCNLNYTRITNIELLLTNTSILNIIKPNKKTNESNYKNLIKKLNAEDDYSEVGIINNEKDAAKNKMYEITLFNNFYVQYLALLFIKFSLKYSSSRNDKYNPLIILNLSCKNKEENNYLVNLAKNILHAKKFKKKICCDEHKIKFMKILQKSLKKNDIPLLFAFLKKYYTNKDFTIFIYFSFYLLTNYSKNQNSKIYSKIFINDIIWRLENEEAFDEIINDIFKKNFKFDFVYKDETTSSFIIMCLSLITNQKSKVFYLFQLLSKDDKVKFIFLIQKLLNSLNKAKTINRMISSVTSNKLANTNDSFILNTKKMLVSLVFTFINEYSQTLDINSVLFLFHLKPEVSNFKKLYIDKVLKFMIKSYEQKIFSLILGIKSLNSKDILKGPLNKLLKITNENEINHRKFYNVIINHLNEFNNINLKLFQELIEKSNMMLIFLNFIMDKNKNKNSLLEILKEKSTKFSKMKKYKALIDLTKQIIINLFFFYHIFELILIMNNFTKISKNNLLYLVSKCYLLLSFYYSIKFPDKDLLFTNEVIDSFYNYLKYDNLDMDYLELFFTFSDLSYTRNNTQVMLNEIQSIVNKKSPLFYEKLMNLNKKKEKFISENKIINFDKLFDFLNNSSIIKFDEFVDVTVEFLNDKLLIRDKMNKIKKKRNVINKDARNYLLNLDLLIDFKKLFSNHDESPLRNKNAQCAQCEEITSIFKEKSNVIRNEQMNNILNYNKENIINENLQEEDLNVTVKIDYYFENFRIIDPSSVTDESDYSINVSNISNISHISESNSNTYLTTNKDNNDNSIITYTNLDFNEPPEKESYHPEEVLSSLPQNDFKEKILQTLNAQNEENDMRSSSIEVKEDKEINFKNIIKENKNQTTNENLKSDKIKKDNNVIPVSNHSKSKLSYLDKKKKYIAIKLFIKILSEIKETTKETFFKILKRIYNNKINQIEVTQIIEINETTNNNKGEIKKLLGKSIYPEIIKQTRVLNK